MARGLDRKNYKYYYVLKDDRGLPEREQTKFWIKPKTGHDQNETTAAYMPAFKEENNRRFLDVAQTDAADRQEFVKHVYKVENYAFSEEYYEKYPSAKERAEAIECEDGITAHFIPEITEDSMIADIVSDLPGSYLREVLGVLDDRSKLTVEEKK